MKTPNDSFPYCPLKPCQILNPLLWNQQRSSWKRNMQQTWLVHPVWENSPASYKPLQQSPQTPSLNRHKRNSLKLKITWANLQEAKRKVKRKWQSFLAMRCQSKHFKDEPKAAWDIIFQIINGFDSHHMVTTTQLTCKLEESNSHKKLWKHKNTQNSFPKSIQQSNSDRLVHSRRNQT